MSLIGYTARWDAIRGPVPRLPVLGDGVLGIRAGRVRTAGEGPHCPAYREDQATVIPC
ncbi:hypothetical protein SCWH03_31110 [Streptomyces pacificus]|uniref:Uncharacterized protein n=1 Tax=Streptomyces pacificus TaxID=2705029 RepID=A0A6A0AW38_9ACTN|nr:hypothetical protein SCWH03_31110 [Streptomyces pacificus]